MIIRDNKEMMYIFVKFNYNGEIVTGSAIGILNHYDEVAKIYNDRFENMCAKKLSKKYRGIIFGYYYSKFLNYLNSLSIF